MMNGMRVSIKDSKDITCQHLTTLFNVDKVKLNAVYFMSFSFQTEAFPYYYKAGFGGHLESLVRCSFFWNTGNFEYIPHNPKQAVL